MEKLNTDELLEVFDYLYGDDLENAADVCKSWNDLIASSTPLLKRFDRMYITVDSQNSIKYAVEKFKRRPYRMLELNISEEENIGGVKELFKAHGHHIDNLEVCFFPIVSLMNLLPLVKNLTSLEVYGISSAPSQSRYSKVDLPHLKELLVLNTTADNVDLIGSHQIEEIYFRFNYTDMNDVVNGKWKEFLATCDKLKKLTLHNYWFNFKLTDLNMRLTEFKLYVDTLERDIPVDDLRDFLKSQKDTLKILILFDYVWEADKYSGLFDFIAFELNLEELYYNLSPCGQMDELKVNKSLKILYFEIENLTEAKFEYYSMLFPGLQAVGKLEIRVTTRNEEEHQTVVKIVNLLTNSMPKLKVLKLNFRNGFERNYLEELNKIRVEQVQILETHIAYEVGEYMSCSPPMIFCPNVKKYISGQGKISAENLEILIQALKNVEEIYATEIEFNEKVVDLILSSKIRKIGLERMLELPEKLKYSKVLVYKRDSKYYQYWQFKYSSITKL